MVHPQAENIVSDALGRVYSAVERRSDDFCGGIYPKRPGGSGRLF